MTTDLIVNATGAWVDETNARSPTDGERPAPFVGGTKGSHLILDHPGLLRALNGHMIYFENVDGRVCILFPYLGRVLLGSTDIRVDKPGDVRCEDDEVDYILKSLSYVFPGIAVRPEDIVYRYSGVRPLPRSEASFTGRISRDHFVAEIDGSPAGALPGRRQVDDVPRLRRAGRRPGACSILGMPRRCGTEDRRIGGGAGFPPTTRGARRSSPARRGLRRDHGARGPRCLDHYGADAGEVLAFCRGRADDAARRHLLHRGRASLPYPARVSRARLGDLLQRRTSIAITGALSSAAIARADRRSSPTSSAGRQRRPPTRSAASAPASARDHGVDRGDPRRTRSEPDTESRMRISPKARMNRLFTERPLPRRRHRPRRLQRADLHAGLEDIGGVVDQLIAAGPDAIQMNYGQADLLQARPEQGQAGAGHADRHGQPLQ